ncbi:S-phase kinase-associated protein 2 [Ischnura elegans]|uniref:S-phase kinase-associated protein 2 n=1 Tax=Ischnura elegans TaxID=197161 RepID=UPI001ED8987B|nr:S-phase kinase-associated protein 2 [Ischnura elegans]
MKGGKIASSAVSESNLSNNNTNGSLESKRRKMGEAQSATDEKSCAENWSDSSNLRDNLVLGTGFGMKDSDLTDRISLDSSFESDHENNNGNVPREKRKRRQSSKCVNDVKDPTNISPSQDKKSRSSVNLECFTIRRRKKSSQLPGKDVFELLSDEMVIQVFRWLPKATLRQCAPVSRRWHRLVNDESLWTRVDLGGSGRTLRPNALSLVLSRGTQVLRLASAEIPDPVFAPDSKFITEKAMCKVQYLDLSMAIISKEGLTMLLESCQQLKKLSLEHCSLQEKACVAIGKNENLEVLNLCSCSGIHETGIRSILSGCLRLQSLNISWTMLDLDSLNYLCANLPADLQRLNISGCRKDLEDSHVECLVNCCPDLVELDLSDCTLLTEGAVTAVVNGLAKIEYLALSRCYHIPISAYTLLTQAESLMYLDVFGLMNEQSLATLQCRLSEVDINKFYFSSVARPTVGIRRTSIWGLRVRD